MGHFSYQCFTNPKKALKRTEIKRTPLKPSRKPINRQGKTAKQWFITRATWIKKNPPPIEGEYWECYLQIHEWCPVRIDIRHLTLDHVISRSRAPSLRFNLDNLKPACNYCNVEKGSRTYEAVMEAKGKRILNSIEESV